MANKDYEQKRAECWEEYCKTHPLCNTPVMRLNFDWTFNRAFALGKQSAELSSNSEQLNAEGKEATMRTIKFRGKDRYCGEWWFGSLAYFPDSQTAHIIPCGTCKNEYVTCDFVEVDPATVGQFTGLKDAEGREIYEGDILKGRTNKWRLEDRPEPHDFIGYVRWEDQCDVGLEWTLASMDSSGFSPLNWYVHCVAIGYSTGIIIGNIHDNPELLKGGIG